MRITKSEAARTQKAKGILALPGNLSEMPVPSAWVYQLPLTEEDRVEISGEIEKFGRLFCRPCPVTPRHGFVDSRPVSTLEDIDQVVTETITADSQAEIVFMPFLDAICSAVVTPCSISIGPGNDGATQGRETLTLPLAGLARDEALEENAHITDCPYYEVVAVGDIDSSETAKLVQIRNGTTPPSGLPEGVDWVPAQTTVHDYIDVQTFGNDALAFEAAVRDAAPGTVILHPGGSILSHYSQHGMLRNMPVIFGTKPHIGSILPPTVMTQAEPDICGFLAGITTGTEVCLTDSIQRGNVTRMALVALHNASVLRGHSQGSRILGLSAFVLLRLAYAALLGEWRHKRKGTNRQSRHDVYSRTLEDLEGFLETRTDVPKAYRSFATAKWKTGYGGLSWAECAFTSMQLERAIVAFCKDQTTSTMLAVIGAAHNVVNCAHNNGPFLSKYIPQSEFDYAARGYLGTVSRGFITAYSLRQARSFRSSVRLLSVLKHREIRTPCELRQQKAARQRARGKKHGNSVSLPRLQVCRRVGKVYHFQYGESGTYTSCDIASGSLTVGTCTLLDQVLSHGVQVPSLAFTSKDYRRLSATAIPQDLVTALNQNHIPVGHMVATNGG